jgi:uncharacterized membrane protein (UPF0127 family)
MEEKHKLKIVYSVVGVVILVILLRYVFSEFYSTSGNLIGKVYVKNILVKAETVKSKEKIERGLSQRKNIAEGRGMLFVMPSIDFQRFWMKGMLFPIDIIWIANGKVIGFEKNISSDDSRVFTSPAAASYVLEVPAGFCDSHNISVNDEVEIR